MTQKIKDFAMKNWYHYAICLVLAVAIMSLSSGCESLDKRYVTENQRAAALFGGDLIERIEADETLTQDSKDRRIKAIKSWQKMNEKTYNFYMSEEGK